MNDKNDSTAKKVETANPVSAPKVETMAERKARLAAELQQIEAAEAQAKETYIAALCAVVAKVEMPEMVKAEGGVKLTLSVSLDAEGKVLVQIGPASAGPQRASRMEAARTIEGATSTERYKGASHYGLEPGMTVVRGDGKRLNVSGEHSFTYGSSEGSLSHTALHATGNFGRKDKHGKPWTIRGPEFWFSGNAPVFKGSIQIGFMEEVGTATGHDWRLKKSS